MEWENIRNKLFFFLIKRIGSEILGQFSLYLKFSFYFFLNVLNIYSNSRTDTYGELHNSPALYTVCLFFNLEFKPF